MFYTPLLCWRDPAFPPLIRPSSPPANLGVSLFLLQGNTQLVQSAGLRCWRAPSAEAPACAAARCSSGRAAAKRRGHFQGGRSRRPDTAKTISCLRHPGPASGKVSESRHSPVAQGCDLLWLRRLQVELTSAASAEKHHFPPALRSLAPAALVPGPACFPARWERCCPLLFPKHRFSAFPGFVL